MDGAPFFVLTGIESVCSKEACTYIMVVNEEVFG